VGTTQSNPAPSAETFLTGLKASEAVRTRRPCGRRGSIKVAPAVSAEFNGVVFGDTRWRQGLHRRAMEAMGKFGPGCLALTGKEGSRARDSEGW
jgi:hypothetical protein